MFQMSFLAQITACWSLACFNDYGGQVDDSIKVVKTLSTLTVTTATTATSSSTRTSAPSVSLSTTPSQNMVKRRSKKSRSYDKHHQPTNQLVKPVSPFEEMSKSPDEMIHLHPFDEVPLAYGRQSRQEVDDRRTRESLDHRDESGRIPFEIAFCTLVPTTVLVPTPKKVQDDASDLSLEDFGEERSLTPHPSFDDVTAPTDIHQLYKVSKRLDEQDWPSDEDGTKVHSGFCFWPDGKLHKRNFKANAGNMMMIMKDLDDGMSKRPTISKGARFRLV